MANPADYGIKTICGVPIQPKKENLPAIESINVIPNVAITRTASLLPVDTSPYEIEIIAELVRLAIHLGYTVGVGEGEGNHIKPKDSGVKTLKFAHSIVGKIYERYKEDVSNITSTYQSHTYVKGILDSVTNLYASIPKSESESKVVAVVKALKEANKIMNKNHDKTKPGELETALSYIEIVHKYIISLQFAKANMAKTAAKGGVYTRKYRKHRKQLKKTRKHRK
jgi:hypothetical protein